MLALERARDLTRDGRAVLFVCFNRALARHVRGEARRAGVQLPSHPADATPDEFWRVDLPDALVDAMAALGPQHDDLLVDEAQDLRSGSTGSSP